MKNKLTNSAGFTLVELLATIVILGILIAIAVPSISSLTERSRLGADQASVGMLNSATSFARLGEEDSGIFTDSSKSEEELIRYLFTEGYLEVEVQPQSRDARFVWENDRWSLEVDGSVTVVSSNLDGVNFGTGFTAQRLIGSYSGGSSSILIPEQLEGEIVREIGQDVFNSKGLVSVSFQNSSQLERIHARAFNNNNLSNIDLPNTLTRIDLWSFRDNNLTTIKLPEGLHTIEQRAFDGNELSEITIGSNVTQIDLRAFGENTAAFKQAYEIGGAGTYSWNGESWIKQ